MEFGGDPEQQASDRLRIAQTETSKSPAQRMSQ